MLTQQKSISIPIKPIFSGPRPDVDRRLFEEQRNYLDRLAHSFHQYFHSPREEADERIHGLYREALDLHKQCEAFSEKVYAFRSEFTVEAGEGSKIEDAHEILDLLPPHRITSGPNQNGYYNRVRFRVAFRREAFPAIAAISSLPEHDFKRAIDFSLFDYTWLFCKECGSKNSQEVPSPTNCYKCGETMITVEDPYKSARLEHKALNDRLQPLRERGFNTWMSIQKVTTSNVLADLSVMGK